MPKVFIFLATAFLTLGYLSFESSLRVIGKVLGLTEIRYRTSPSLLFAKFAKILALVWGWSTTFLIIFVSHPWPIFQVLMPVP